MVAFLFTDSGPVIVNVRLFWSLFGSEMAQFGRCCRGLLVPGSSRCVMRQYRLSTLFIAVFLISGNLAVARWESELGIITAATTLAVVAIVVARRANRSRFVS